MERELAGIHHITAISGEPGTNVEFYTRVLGLRMVKRTVNFDSPDTWHLYFGDDQGRPGTVLTFFPWPHLPRGEPGPGQATAVAFSVPRDSLGWWEDRLRDREVDSVHRMERAGERVLSFRDPDGLPLELVELDDERPGYADGPVGAEHRIRGFAGVMLTVARREPTARFLAETLGFRKLEGSGGRTRYVTGPGGPGTRLDLVAPPSPERGGGSAGVGTVHHIAWRTPDTEEQVAWRERLEQRGANVTPVIDRHYFHSIYFREPGGVLFEIATEGPGFTADEPAESLGEELRLPPWLEDDRERIARSLPDLRPAGAGA